MATQPKCPECGSTDLKSTWKIKNNLMARCNGCRRTVRLGKPGEQQPEETPSGEGGAPAKKTATPARSGGRRMPAKRAGARKAGGVPERTVQPKPKSDDPLGDAVKRAFRWLNG